MTAGEPGSVAEEASRLVEALAGWAAQWAGSSLGAERLATGAPECQLCPVCLLVRAVRTTRPETVEHLLDAVNSVSAALRAAINDHSQHWASRAAEPVQHIVVD